MELKLKIESNKINFTLNNYIYDIVKNYHMELKDILQRIEYLILDLDIRYRETNPELKEIRVLFSQFRSILIRHLINEEALVFPAIIEIEKNFIENKKEKVSNINKILNSRINWEHEEMRLYLDNILSMIEESRIKNLQNKNHDEIFFLFKKIKDNLETHWKIEDNNLYPAAINMYNTIIK